MSTVQSIDDVLFDLECSFKAAPIMERLNGLKADAQVIARIEERYRKRTTPEPDTRYFARPSESGIGRAIIKDCTEDNLKRYRTMLYLEEEFPDDGDYGMLIVSGCQILESEVDRRLISSAKLIAPELVRSLKEVGDRKQAAVLERWVNGQIPSTIGVQALVLFACYRAIHQQSRETERFLRYEFSEHYYRSCTDNRLGRMLDCIRTEFRNPACHGGLPPFYVPGAVRVGSTVTNGSSGRRSAAESARGAIAPYSAGVRYPNEL